MEKPFQISPIKNRYEPKGESSMIQHKDYENNIDFNNEII
jgi:hypothetical protein